MREKGRGAETERYREQDSEMEEEKGLGSRTK